MAYWSPIEANHNKIEDIKKSNGNFIIDVDENQVLYDTKDNRRIIISNLEFVDSEADLMKITGVPNKIYIIKNTGAAYFWIGGGWNSVSEAGNITGDSDTVLTVSPDGDEDSDGTDPNSPAKTISQLIKRYGNARDITIHVIGTINEPHGFYVDGKNINIYGDGSTSIINIQGNPASMRFFNSTFHLSNLVINGTFEADTSTGSITNCDIDTIHSENSIVYTSYSSFGRFYGLGNGINTISEIHSNTKYSDIIINAAYGSIISVNDTDDPVYSNISYSASSAGKIYRTSEPISEDEKNFILNLLGIKEIY